MTDKRNVVNRPAADDAKETWSRVSKLSQDKFKAKKYSKGRKQAKSPCLGTSLAYRKVFETPKRQSRIRFNGGSNGDSPSEAEALQDIIWDPASSPPMWNGKGAGERVVEISDIVNRIAPIDKKPVDRDLVLQWIGDSAVPCTPEVQQPRVQRISTRRQSNNVEDLMKLAKQFDINMTRQDQERNLQKQQTNHPEPEENKTSTLTGAQTSIPVKPKQLTHEEELHALFDGPTQNLSGRISPPSVDCSQESRTDSTTISAKMPVSTDSKNKPEDTADTRKPDFDDDWENDDLMNDSFVLEMTQNPELCSLARSSSTVKMGSNVPKKCESTIGNSSVSNSRTGVQGGTSSHFTRITSKAPSTTSSTFKAMPKNPVHTKTVQPLPKASPGESKKGQAQAQISHSKQAVVKAVVSDEKKIKNEGGKSSGSNVASGKDHKPLESDSIWGDGNFDDDDLLYQACDDVERISASQEQQKEDKGTELASKNYTSSSCKKPSPIGPSSLPSTPVNSKTVQSRSFGRCHSVPGASSTFGYKQLGNISQVTDSSQSHGQYRFTRVNQASGVVLNPRWATDTLQEAGKQDPSAGNPTNSHHSTFKRHQSDPVALSNKVFVAARPAVKCTAAEIERKKQEALARRRSRLQATLKPGAPT